MSAAEDPGYDLCDADQHYYEPRDCFTRHIASKDQAKAIAVRPGLDGRDVIWVGDKRFTFLDWNFDRCAKPGALKQMLKLMQTPDYQDQVIEDLRPEYVERAARLASMDRQGVESTLMFPTLAVCVEQFMKDDADQMYLNFRSFNQWLLETWGYGADGRIFAAPLLSLLDLDRAVAELDRLLADGARVLSLRPGPAYGRSPADPYFDPVWSRIDEAGVAVAFHIGESGYNEMMSVHWGEAPAPSSHRQSAFQWTSFYGDRPIMDTVSALIFHNLFGRFPNVRIVSVENGSHWVSYLLKAMDKMGGMGRNGPWIGGRIREKPSAIARRHLFVSPYYEEDVEELVSFLGPTQVVFGSDHPHPEGLADPASYLEEIPNLSVADRRRVMRDNTRSLMGLA